MANRYTSAVVDQTLPKELAQQRAISGIVENAQKAGQQSKLSAQEADQGMTLHQLLGKQKSDLSAQEMGQKDELDNKRVQRDIDTVQKLQALGLGRRGIKAGEVGITEQPNQQVNPIAQQRLDMQRDKQDENKAVDLSKRYEKSQGFQSALQEIEANTNREGGGGIVTNPNAKMNSTGKVLSGLPASAVGIGEMIGAVPKGSTAERKGLERLQLEYQKAMGGMRQTDQMRQAERAAMGMITSGDPDLVAKGVRSLARNVKNGLHTVEAGYTDDVRNAVHSRLGGSPADALGNIYDDNAQAAPQVSPHNQNPPAQSSPDALMKRLQELEKRRNGG